MSKLNRINIIALVIGLTIFSVPQQVIAQHFGHGGGGGGFHGGGGGGFHGGGGARGGGGFRAGSPAGNFHSGGNTGFRPAPAAAPRTINGGMRNFGNHDIGRGRGLFGGGRPIVGGIRNEGAFHHVYGGMRPYAYHPYHPYYWGRYWHPFGFFVGALAADAIMLDIAGEDYYYDNGVYYEPSNGGYTVVAPPIGAVVSYLPQGYITIPMDNGTYYYYGGTFYVQQGSNSFRVVPAPVGAIVDEIPEGATQQVINNETYLLYNNTYYEPVSQDGQDAYQVVQVN